MDQNVTFLGAQQLIRADILLGTICVGVLGLLWM